MINNNIVKKIMEKSLDKNLDDSDHNKLMELWKTLSKSIESVLQNFIDEEENEFRLKHSKVELKRTYNMKKKTLYGPIELKVPEFRHTKFESLIIRTKARNFCFETFILIALLYTGNMTYEHITNFCNMFDLSISTKEISNIIKAVKEIKQEE